MSRRSASLRVAWLGVGLLALAAGGALAEPWMDQAMRPVKSPPRPQDVPGVYHMVGFAGWNEMIIVPSRSGYRLSLRATGNPNDGQSMTGLCEIEAEGRLSRGRLEAPLIPFHGRHIRVDAQALRDRPAKVVVRFDGEAVVVATDFDGCPWRSDVSATYRKGSAKDRSAFLWYGPADAALWDAKKRAALRAIAQRR